MKQKLFSKKKMILYVLVLLFAAVIAAIWISRAQAQARFMAEAINSQETALVEKRDLVSSISATGKISSVGSKDVAVSLSGATVEEIKVKVGDQVTEGDILCIFDSSDIEQSLADARTSFNSSTGKSSIDVSSAERSLAEAEAGRNIEAERANKDVADAWNDYLLAVTDLEEAEDEYNKAISETNEKKGEYDRSQELLEEAEKRMNSLEPGAGNTGTGNGQSNAMEIEFDETLTSMKAFIAGDEAISANPGVMNLLYITNPSLTEITVDHFVISDTGNAAESENTENNVNDIDPTSTVNNDMSSADKRVKLEQYLGSLKNIAQNYQILVEAQEDDEKQKAAAEAVYQQAQTEYQELQQEVSSWQTKYNTAKSMESSMKTAWEQAKSTVDSKLDTYNQQVRSQEDTVRSNDSTVANKQDSVSTSRLNASTTGVSDRQSIRQYEEQLEMCTVTAPMSGVITAVNLEKGDSYSGNAIVTIEDTSAYEISAEIDEYDIGKIKVGQQVLFKTNGTGEEELYGTVKEIAPRATTGGSEVTYNVRVSIDTPEDSLKMDMTAKLGIILEEEKDVLTVPYEAVQEEDGSYYIEVVENGNISVVINEEADVKDTDIPEAKEERAGEEGQQENNRERKTKRIVVEKGIESDYYIEVIGDTLREGMEVLIPQTTEISDISDMLQMQGPMGGF